MNADDTLGVRRDVSFLGGSVACIVAADFLLPDYGMGLPVLAFGVLCVAVIERSVRRHQPRHPTPFHAMSVAAVLVCSAYAWQVMRGGPIAHSTLSDTLILVGLSIWALVFALFILARSVVYDRYQLLDITIVLVSALVGIKALVLDPMLTNHTPVGMSHDLAMASFLVECVGLVMIGRTMTMPGTKPVSMWLLLASMASSFTGGVLLNSMPSAAGMHISLFLAGTILLLACEHPSMVDLTEPATGVTANFGIGRAAALGGALVITPISSAWVAHRTDHFDAAALVVTTLFITSLVVIRIRLLFAQERQAHARVEASRLRFATMLRGLTDVILSLDDHGVITYASPSCTSALGIDSSRLEGLPLSSLVVEGDAAAAAVLLRATIGSGQPSSAQLRVQVGHAVRAFEATITDHLHDEHIGGMLVALHDVTERNELESRLRYQALHDALTGLPNRTLLAERLGSAMTSDRELGVLFVDLDDFKAVNDGLGHEVGDLLLCAVASRLRGAIRDGDMVARLGGDEFAVIVRGGCPAEVGARLLAALAEPFELCGHRIHVSASVGVAHSARTADELLRKADMAMYRAKADGKGAVAVFEPDMEQRVSERLLVQMELTDALRAGELRVVYQPIYGLANGRLTGGEALLRWQHPTRGLLGPDRFIAVAEETGLIVSIGRWVLHEACTKAASWPEAVDIAVNLSARQLESDDIVADVRAVLDATGLAPSRLVLEITETMLSRDVDATAARLGMLAGLGVRIAIDDFGTGYSSLSTLNRFPVDVLKIDRSFVAAMLANNEASALVHVLLEMGRALHLDVVAEGIEEEEQAEALRALLCDHGQGFYFSRPVDADAFARLVDDRSPTIV